MRLDSIFGFRSFDSQLADNYSSCGSSYSQQETLPSATTNYRKLSCIICLDNFKQKDHVVKLGCHDKHVFHYKCIEEWICSELIKCLDQRFVTIRTLDILSENDYKQIQCPLCKFELVKAKHLKVLRRKRQRIQHQLYNLENFRARRQRNNRRNQLMGITYQDIIRD